MSVKEKDRNETTHHVSDMNMTGVEDVEIGDDDVFGENENVSEIESQKKEETESGRLEKNPDNLNNQILDEESEVGPMEKQNRKMSRRKSESPSRVDPVDRQYRRNTGRKGDSLSGIDQTKDTKESKTRRKEKEVTSNKVAKYPCGVCGQNVGWSAKNCGGCKFWIHNRCDGTKPMKTGRAGRGNVDEAEEYRCPKCIEGLIGAIKEIVPIAGSGMKGRRREKLKINDQNISTTKAATDSDSEKRKREETGNEDATKDKRQKTQDNRKPYEEDVEEDDDEIEKGNEHIRRGSSILNLSIFKIHKRCIDCDGEYEAIYNEIGGLNCWVCGLTTHGCRHNQKVQEADLYKMSKGYKWMCYDCTKEVESLREENRRWKGEEETEKNGERTTCSKCSSKKLTERIEVVTLGRDQGDGESPRLSAVPDTPSKTTRPGQPPLTPSYDPPMSPCSPMSPSSPIDGPLSGHKPIREKTNGHTEDVEDELQTDWRDHIRNINEIDIESTKEGKWLTDAIIIVMMKIIQEWLHKKGEKVICLEPSVVHCIRNEGASEDSNVSVEDIINKRRLEDNEYIILPVNNNDNLESDAGSHWSLLLYRKKSNKFYHFDSIKGANEKYARQITRILAKANKCFTNEMINSESPQQKDAYSCGIYTIMNTIKIAENIINKKLINKIEMGTGDIAKTRKWINDIITIEKDHRENNSKDKSQMPQMLIYQLPLKECWFHTNGTCRFAGRCLNEHKRRCPEQVMTGRCHKEKCKDGHPIVCRNIERDRYCSITNCLYLHPTGRKGQDRGHIYSANGSSMGQRANKNFKNKSHKYKKWGYGNEYGGYERYDRGNNWNNNSNMGYGEYDGRDDWSYRDMGNFHEEWPTPWEGRMLRMMERRMKERWEENRW